MYKVKTLNNISPSAKEVLNENEYEMSDTVADPDALFVRASDLHDYPWTDNIKCIGRAGIGVNTIPLEVLRMLKLLPCSLLCCLLVPLLLGQREHKRL